MMRGLMKAVPILSTFAVVFSFAAGAQQQPAGEPKLITQGPTREIKFSDNTYIRFGFQIQAWARAAQDAAKQASGDDGLYAYDIYCRRCRLFSTGSIVKNVTYNILFEAGNFGRATAAGDKNYNTIAGVPAQVAILDAYGQIKLADYFQVMAGSMVVPLTRNGNQPTTTYVPIDVAFTSATLLGDGGFIVNAKL